MRTRAAVGLALAGAAVLAAPALASYGGGPVPPAAGRALAYYTYGVPGGIGECSGVLIAPRAVLTAAHCVRNEGTGRAHDVVGRTVYIGPSPARATARTVRSVAVHPRFRARNPSAGFDVAVLRLDRAAGRTPARLATAAEETRLAVPPVRVVASGFGIVRPVQPVGRRPARRVSLELLSPFNCINGTAAVNRFRRSFVCAAHPAAGICAGDSGGPLTVSSRRGPRVIGVTSQALVESACGTQTVGIFARIVPVRAWIMLQVRRS